MSCLEGKLPDPIVIKGRDAIPLADAIAAAGHVAAAMRLLLPGWDGEYLGDLTLWRLIDCLGGFDVEVEGLAMHVGDLANRLLDEAEDLAVPQWQGVLAAAANKEVA